MSQYFRYVYPFLTVISPCIVAVHTVLLTQIHLVMTTKAKILDHLERWAENVSPLSMVVSCGDWRGHTTFRS